MFKKLYVFVDEFGDIQNCKVKMPFGLSFLAATHEDLSILQLRHFETFGTRIIHCKDVPSLEEKHHNLTNLNNNLNGLMNISLGSVVFPDVQDQYKIIKKGFEQSGELENKSNFEDAEKSIRLISGYSFIIPYSIRSILSSFKENHFFKNQGLKINILLGVAGDFEAWHKRTSKILQSVDIHLRTYQILRSLGFKQSFGISFIPLTGEVYKTGMEISDMIANASSLAVKFHENKLNDYEKNRIAMVKKILSVSDEIQGRNHHYLNKNTNLEWLRPGIRIERYNSNFENFLELTDDELRRALSFFCSI